MAVNLLNTKALTTFVNRFVFNEPINTSVNATQLKDINFLEQNKELVTRCILAQYAKHRLTAYLSESENMPFFQEVTYSDELPEWALKAISEGRKLYRFLPTEIPPKNMEELKLIAQYLFNTAKHYVQQKINLAKKTKKEPKIRLDYLKTSNEYSSVKKTFTLAYRWHLSRIKQAEEERTKHLLKRKADKGTTFVCDLPKDMYAVRLTTPEALDYEELNISHCIGNGSYDDALLNNEIEIYSIRHRSSDMPAVTFEIQNNVVIQCRGHGNLKPALKYIKPLQALILKQGWKVKGDLKYTHFIRQDGNLYSIWDLPKNFVVKGNLDISYMDLPYLPNLSDVTVMGSFIANDNRFKSLVGMPKYIGGNCDISNSGVTSLNGMTQHIGGYFQCNDNKCKNLLGGPQYVGKDFIVRRNGLESLEGIPTHLNGSLFCDKNNLQNLQGGPSYVKGDYICSNNKLQQGDNKPVIVMGMFDCASNKLTSFRGLPVYIGKIFNCNNNDFSDFIGIPQYIGRYIQCTHNPKINEHSFLPEYAFNYQIALYNVPLSQAIKNNNQKRVQVSCHQNGICPIKKMIRERDD